jgi:hypothetical protein
MTSSLARRLCAEYLGSAFLAAVVIGSGIAAQQLSPDDTGLALLENAAATAAGLFAIILMFGPVSGGHFNPVVSLVDAHFGGCPGATRSPTSPRRSQAASPARSPPTACSPWPPSASPPTTGPVLHTCSLR